MKIFLLIAGIVGIIYLVYLFTKIYKIPDEEKDERFGVSVMVTTTLIFGLSVLFIVSSFFI